MADDITERDFLLFSFLRLSGAAILILGFVITFSDLVTPGGEPLLGIPLALAGLAEALFASRIVRRLKAR
jgi:hypothetical protein